LDACKELNMQWIWYERTYTNKVDTWIIKSKHVVVCIN
jgi:hypothetical protein